jgi:hypothetical protein
MDSDEVDDAGMAAAMGFSSFGGARPAKKRRFHTGDDAVLDGQVQPREKHGFGTGTNAVPVRTFRDPGRGASANAGVNSVSSNRSNDPNELLLEDEDELDGDVAGSQVTREAAGSEEDKNTGSDPEPRYLETSRLATVVSEGLDGHSSFSETYPEPSNISGSYRGGFQDRRGRGRGGHHGGRHGDSAPGTPWWTSYHDPSFNQNPWERLERTLGLEARGSWVTQRGG